MTWVKTMASFEFGRYANGSPFVEVWVFGSKKLFAKMLEYGAKSAEAPKPGSIEAVAFAHGEISVTRKIARVSRLPVPLNMTRGRRGGEK